MVLALPSPGFPLFPCPDGYIPRDQALCVPNAETALSTTCVFCKAERAVVSRNLLSWVESRNTYVFTSHALGGQKKMCLVRAQWIFQLRKFPGDRIIIACEILKLLTRFVWYNWGMNPMRHPRWLCTVSHMILCSCRIPNSDMCWPVERSTVYSRMFSRTLLPHFRYFSLTGN